MTIVDTEILEKLNHQWDSLEWNFFKNTAEGISRWSTLGWNKFRTTIKKIGPFVNENRALVVFLIAVIEIRIIYVFFDDTITFFKVNDALAKALSSTIPILIAAPIAFLIWHFRDQNKLAEISIATKQAESAKIQAESAKEQAESAKEQAKSATVQAETIKVQSETAIRQAETSKENIVQKDFYEIQNLATDSKNKTQQVSAIHQLKPYAIGEHGERYRRPAYEIYHALLEEWQPAEPNRERVEIIIPSHIKAIHTVFREKGKGISTDMQEINLSHAHLPTIDLVGVSLFGANLQFANLASANLQSADLFGSNLYATELRGANFQSANLQGADLKSANFFIEHIIHATNWNGPYYDELVQEKLNTFYERLKEKGEGGYWDPYTGKYVEETKEEE